MIGIITSGTENYNLIKLCHKFNIPYCIIVDTDFWPYQDKSIETIITRIDFLIKQAQKIGCTHIFLSPVYELYYAHILLKKDISIIPLFNHYINNCFHSSLIGKIGYIGGYMDIKLINIMHSKFTNNYQLTDNQNNIKSFQNPLAKRTKDTSMRTFFSRFYSNRTMMINKIIKFDLRYLKDANIDTIIPLNYEYFNYQRTISLFFNPKKQKFHKRSIIETLFVDLIQELSLPTHTQSEVTIVITGSDHLLTNKKWETIASHGGKYKLVYKSFNV